MFSGENKNKSDIIDGIVCSVSNCEHHGSGSTCHAGGIKIGTEYAHSKDETFCSTYAEKETY